MKKIIYLVVFVFAATMLAYSAYSELPATNMTKVAGFTYVKAKGSVIRAMFYTHEPDNVLLNISDMSQSPNSMRYCFLKLDDRGKAILDMINTGAEIEVQYTAAGTEKGFSGYTDCGDVTFTSIMR